MKRLLIVIALFAAACSLRTEPEEIEPPAPVDVVELDSAEAEALRTELATSKSWTVDEFLQAHPSDFETTLPYDPLTAVNLDLIEGSSFAMSGFAKDALQQNGFAMTQPEFPTFVYGYATIYLEDLPVFISADSILFAVHRSYDKILSSIEQEHLLPALIEVLGSMRNALRAGKALGYTADQELDLDLYLAVALHLATEQPAPTLVGGDQNRINSFVDKAVAADGVEELVLFGANRKVDWSQFKPRGHYTDTPELSAYFRAMMWLGRIDFRMLEPDESNTLMLHRRQVYNTLALAQLLDEEATEKYLLIHDTVGAFVGEPDGLTLGQIPDLLRALGVDDPAAVKSLSDEAIATAIQKHQFGAQRIASHYMINSFDGTTKPLAHSFALMGQRYVIDSHVLANVVFDRVGQGQIDRMMPDPLDVAFAALENDFAATLLEPQLREFGYQHDLEAMRVLVNQHEEAFWDDNLYNRWLTALRTLSTPTAEAPAVMKSEPWARRTLNTQLASWAELRHDTILYSKQSYSAGGACEYPDAYVEPNPAFFAAIADFAVHGRGLTAAFKPAYGEYFDGLEEAARHLEAMAEAQATGAPHTESDLAWINDAVTLEPGCDGPAGALGWYPKLFFGGDALEFDPTIADVHTQPTDRSGNEVGRILHVGTRNAQSIIVTVETCEGPRAYVGLASTYYELVTDDFERLTDEEWANDLRNAKRPDWLP